MKKQNILVVGLIAALTITACSKMEDTGTTSPHPMTLECQDQQGDIWQRYQGITNAWNNWDVWKFRTDASEAMYIYRMLPGEACYLVNEDVVL